jgi:hypothetical protein
MNLLSMELFEYKSLILEYNSRIYGQCDMVIPTYRPIKNDNLLYLVTMWDLKSRLKYLLYVIIRANIKTIYSKYLICTLNYNFKECLININYLVYGFNVNNHVQYNYKNNGYAFINYNNVYYYIYAYNPSIIFIHFDLLGNIINIEPDYIYTRQKILRLLANAKYFPKGFYDYYSNKLIEYGTPKNDYNYNRDDSNDSDDIEYINYSP